MKKLGLALGSAALMAMAAISAPAQAQTGGSFIAAQVYVVPPPPPRRYYAPPPPPRYYGHRYHGPQRYYRAPPRHYGRRDNDRDGVPNRFDRRPNNPYRY